MKIQWSGCLILVGSLVLSCGELTAQEAAQGETKQIQQLTSTLSVRIRQKSGIAASGTLISLTADTIKFRTTRGKEVEIDIDKIRNVRTIDGVLDYSPAKESFESLVRRSTQIPGLTAGTVEVVVPIERVAPGESVPALPNASNPKPGPAEGPLVDPAMDAVGPAPPPENMLDPVGTAPEGTGPTMRTPGSTIYTCATCGDEVPGTLSDGEKCPHCGITIWNGRTARSDPATRNPGTQPAGPGNPGNARPANSTTPASSTPTTRVTQPTGTSFDDAPTWMKVGFFVGLLAVAWVVFQRR